MHRAARARRRRSEPQPLRRGLQHAALPGDDGRGCVRKSSRTRDDVIDRSSIVPRPAARATAPGSWAVRWNIDVRVTSHGRLELDDATRSCGGRRERAVRAWTRRISPRSVGVRGWTAATRTFPAADSAPPTIRADGRSPSFEPASRRRGSTLATSHDRRSRSTTSATTGSHARQGVASRTASSIHGVVSMVRRYLAQPISALRTVAGQIELRSSRAPIGQPFQNYYDHGWRPGVETRRGRSSCFDVLWFENGRPCLARSATSFVR